MKIDLTKEELERLIMNMDQISVEYGDIDDKYLLIKLIEYNKKLGSEWVDDE